MKTSRERASKSMHCPKCKAPNLLGREFCSRCGSRLPLIELPEWSEVPPPRGNGESEIERISALEEKLRQSGETLEAMKQVLDRQEKAIILNHNAFLALADILSRQGRIRKDELYSAWEERLSQSLRRMGMASEFERLRPRILALAGGEKKIALQSALESAFDKVLAGETREGMKEMEDLFQRDRENYEIAFLLGELYFAQGELGPSEKYLAISLRANPRHAVALMLDGLVCLREPARLKGALKRLEKAHLLSGGAALPALCLGAALSMDGDHEAALRRLTESRRSAPTALSWILEGRIMAHLDRFKEAERALRSAAVMDPEDLRCPFALTALLLQTDRLGEAMEALRRGLFLLQPRVLDWLEPPQDFLVPHAGQGVPTEDVEAALVEISRFLAAPSDVSVEERYEKFRRDLRHAPHAQAVFAGEALSRGHRGLASRVARDILRESETALDRVAALAVLFHAETERQEIRRLLEADFSRPHDPRGRFALAYMAAIAAWKDSGDREAARLHFERSLDSAPSTGIWRSRLGLAWLALIDGDTRTAESHLRESLTHRAFPGTTLLLAATRALQSERAEAVSLFHEAWPLHTGVFPTWELLREEVLSFDMRSLVPPFFERS